MTELSATGHTPRVVEHLRRWGLLQRVRDAWTYPPEWHRGTRLVTSPAWHEPAPVPAPSFTERGGAVGHSSDEALRRPQTVFQRVFLDHLTEQGVSVSGGWELTAVRGDTDGVDAEVVNVDSGRSHTMRAAYVLGTDGGSSTTRRLAGIGRAGEHATEKRLRLIVRTGDISDRVGPAPSATNIVVNSRASGFLAAVSAREWRVYDGPYPLDHEPGEDELLEVGRAAFGFDAPTDEVQRAPWADAYLAAWDQPHRPRIGISRCVFPAKDRRTALRAVEGDVHRAALRMAEHGAFPKGLAADEALRRFHAFYGHPDDIVAALRQEQVPPVATDLITQFNPAVPDHDAAVRALELIATEVAPALGWTPAQPAEPASAGV